MELKLKLLADYANVTKEGKLNVMGIFSKISTPTLPCIHPQMQLVLQFEAGSAEWETQKEIQIKLMDADGKQLLAIGGSVTVPKGEAGKPVQLNSIMTFGNVKFEKEGDYCLAILIGGETKGEIPLTVHYSPPATPK